MNIFSRAVTRFDRAVFFVASLAVAIGFAAAASAQQSQSSQLTAGPAKKAQSAATSKAPSKPQPPALMSDGRIYGWPLPITGQQRELFDVLNDAARRYQQTRTGAQRTTVRLAMQTKIADFMDVNQEAVDWTGILRSVNATDQGNMSIIIEMAPNMTVTTWSSRESDAQDLTLIRRASPLYQTLNDMLVGQFVKFSATMLVYDVTHEDEMVLHPHIVARFKSIKALEPPPSEKTSN